jgi:uncharacterized protein YegP (UPF0339 family)
MAGKFELYKDAAGKFRFRLMASNGEQWRDYRRGRGV